MTTIRSILEGLVEGNYDLENGGTSKEVVDRAFEEMRKAMPEKKKIEKESEPINVGIVLGFNAAIDKVNNLLT